MTRDLWDPPSVIEAIERAGATWAALPRDRGPAQLKAAWPETFQEIPGPNDFDAKRHFDATRYIRDSGGRPTIAADGETKATVWAKGFERSTPPTAAEIDHADMVADWNRFFAERTDYMDAVWLCCGAGFNASDAAKIIARRRKLKSVPSRHHIARLRDQGIAAIVFGLNKPLIQPVPTDLEERSVESTEIARFALIAALEALQPLVSALATGDAITRTTVPVSVRHLYKAAQASAKILKALSPTENET